MAVATAGSAPEERDGERVPASPPDSDIAVPAAARPVLPERAREDTDAAWGERPEPDDDERLRRERPPHWDLG